MMHLSSMAPRRRVPAALASCVLLASLASLASCADGGSDDVNASSTKPTGKVEVAGHRLYAKCTGHDGPTVVFLHGLGGEGQDWALTAKLLEGAHSCWYDRLGVGRSDQDTARHSALDSVEDLHRLLPKIGAKPPYVLVGHSYGGMLALMYAGTHPDEIDGLVLADATLPFEPALDPPHSVDDVTAEMDDNQENLDAYDGYAVARRLEASLPDVPITVMNGRLTELPAEWSKATYDQLLRAWVDGLDQGTLYDCDCDHDMPSDVPDLVAQKIRDLISEESP